MNQIPDDVLLLVFDAYVHGLGLAPSSLLSVSRRWQALLLSTPLLWSRIKIHIRSIKTIPSITENCNSGLQTYLSRSSGPDTNVPLDISIIWHHSVDYAGDHASTCGVSPLEVFNCPETPCLLQLTYERQLEVLLQTLLSWSSTSTEFTTSLEVVWRCRSLEFDLRGFNDPSEQWRRPISLSPLGKSSSSGDGFTVFPSLQSITIRNFIASIPVLSAPRLRRIELSGAGFEVFPSLQTVETIILKRAVYYRGTSRLHGQLPWASCTNLKTLEVGGDIPYDIPRAEELPFPNLETFILRIDHRTIGLGTLGLFVASSQQVKQLVLLGISPEETESYLKAIQKYALKKIALASSFHHIYYRDEWRHKKRAVLQLFREAGDTIEVEGLDELTSVALGKLQQKWGDLKYKERTTHVAVNG